MIKGGLGVFPAQARGWDVHGLGVHGRAVGLLVAQVHVVRGLGVWAAGGCHGGCRVQHGGGATPPGAHRPFRPGWVWLALSGRSVCVPH